MSTPDTDVTLSFGVLKDVEKADIGQIQVACATLANLAGDPDASARIESEGGASLILSALRRSTGEHPLAVQGCLAALVNLSSTRPGIKASLSPASANPAVDPVSGLNAFALSARAARAHPSDPVVTRYALWVLATVSLGDPAAVASLSTDTTLGLGVAADAAGDAKNVAGGGGVVAEPLEVSVSEMCPEGSQAHPAVAFVVSSLLRSIGAAGASLDADGVGCATAGEGFDQESARVACAIVGELSRAPGAVRSCLVKSGAVSAVSAVLRSESAGVEACVTACQAVQNLLFGIDADLGALAMRGGCQLAVAEAMVRHAGAEGAEPLCVAGVGAITNSLTLGTDAMRSDGGKLGPGTLAVIKALDGHRTSAAVQRGGCMVIGCVIELVYNGGKGVPELMDLLGAMCSAGAVASVVSALGAHRADATVARAACAALQNLALGGTNAGPLGDAGAVPAVCMALSSHPQAEKRAIQLAALGVLNNALRLEANAREALGEQLDLIGTVVALLKTHPRDQQIQRRGLAVLGQLALVSDEARAAIGEKGGIEACTAALVNFKMDPGVVEVALGALRNATFGGDNAELLKPGGAVAAAIDAMRQHPMNVAVQHAGCGLLVNATLDNEDNREEVARLGGAEIFETALKNHSANAAVQRSGALALSIVNETLDEMAAAKEAAREAEEAAKRAEEEAKAAATASAESAAAAAAAALATATDTAAKVVHARSKRMGRVADLIHLYESGDLYRWEPPAKTITLATMKEGKV